MNHRLNYILELLKKYPNTKYILTNQFLAGDLVHSYVDDENKESITFSFTAIPETKKLYGVYSHPIKKSIVVFDANFKYPLHTEYCLCGDNLEPFFKTNCENIDNFNKNEIRSERLKTILGEIPKKE